MISTAVPSLVLFVFAATFSPGGATVLVTASGLRNGLRSTMPLIVGMAGALAFLAAAAALGLGSFMTMYPALETLIRIAGTVYLLWLALAVARAAPPSAKGPSDQLAPGFVTGVFLLWLNPKAWATTLSAAAAFGQISGTPTHTAAILGAAFLVFGLLSLTLWAAFGQLLGRLLKSERQWRVTNLIFAILIVASVGGLWSS